MLRNQKQRLLEAGRGADGGAWYRRSRPETDRGTTEEEENNM
jgi:hypothetical protein